MKNSLLGLKRGDVVEAKVSERLSSTEYIVSIDGQLIQVQNKTPIEFALETTVRLVVSQVQPLKFKVFDGLERGHRRGLDLDV